LIGLIIALSAFLICSGIVKPKKMMEAYLGK